MALQTKSFLQSEKHEFSERQIKVNFHSWRIFNCTLAHSVTKMKFKLRRNFFVDKPKVFSLFFYFPKKVFPPKKKRIFLFFCTKNSTSYLKLFGSNCFIFPSPKRKRRKTNGKVFPCGNFCLFFFVCFCQLLQTWILRKRF